MRKQFTMRSLQVAAATILSLCTAVVCTGNKLYVLPNETAGCPANSHPCYTFPQFLNQASHIGPNTMVVFLPGLHSINYTGHMLIANVDNFVLTGTESDKIPTMVQCTGKFGFGFMNITNLTIKSIQFTKCGALISDEMIKQFSDQMLHETNDHFEFTRELLTCTFKYPTLYMTQVKGLSISKVHVHKSEGIGLVGLNVLGNSSISQSTLASNNPNCAFLFLDSLDTSQSFMHTILIVSNSEFISGESKGNKCSLAAGLTLLWTQTTFFSTVQFNNVATHNNTGDHNGNVLLRMPECSQDFVSIQAYELNCTNGIGGTGLSIEFSYSFIYPCSCSRMQLHKREVIQISNSYFGNHAAGGAITIQVTYVHQCIHPIITLWNSTVEDNKGIGIYIFRRQTIVLRTTVVLDDVTFTNNEGALLGLGINIIAKGNTSFIHNNYQMIRKATLLLQHTNITFIGNITFAGNIGHDAGAIYADQSSTLIFKKNTTFVQNEGYNGGAIAFYGQSVLLMTKYAKIHFIRNHARNFGGALYVNKPTDYTRLIDSYVSIKKSKCFYDIGYTVTVKCEKCVLNDPGLVHLFLTDNQADYAGSALYGGWIDLCAEHPGDFSDFFQITRSNSSDFSVISSNPSRICICFNSTPDCSIINYNVTAYPGQTFQISAIGVGQRLGTVPATVYSQILRHTISNTHPRLDRLQYAQETSNACTNLSYTVKSPNCLEEMLLIVDKLIDITNEERWLLESVSRQPLQFTNVHVYVNLLPCPLGFLLDINNSCICDPRLQVHTITCYIDTQKIQRERTLWINATFTEEEPVGYLVHNHCPFDYCKPYSLNLSLENPDEQCAFNRSGVLCGACLPNFSHLLGSSKCHHCNSFGIFLILAFALAGISLVFFLMLLNITVSIGTINGLIFYANIVRANQATFFPPTMQKYSFHSHFIAWINLDFGVETCFYNGMDAYGKTWLQFLFPVYIWIIVIMIIVSSHYSTIAGKLAGRNAVQVLATLFLLSYAKLVRLTITVFSSTSLKYPDGSLRRVWLYDGNVDYLKGKHIPLFLSALLVVLVLSIPYTTLLLLIECLQLKSKYRVLFWIAKFKPLFDAYTGPYKDKHRHWTGLLLSIRIILFVTFSVNVLGDPAINLLAIAIITTCLFVYTFLFGGIYKSWYINVLECSYFFNLSVLSTTTLFTRLTSGNQTAVIYTSVSVAFVTFKLVVLCHMVYKIASFRQQCKQGLTSCVEQLQAKIQNVRLPRQNNEHRNQCALPAAEGHQATVTFLELREPMLDYCN